MDVTAMKKQRVDKIARYASPIVIKDVDGRCCPRLRCQVCGELIEANNGNLFWKGLEEDLHSTIVVCKNPCTREHGFGSGDGWLSDEISDVLVFLALNSKVKDLEGSLSRIKSGDYL